MVRPQLPWEYVKSRLVRRRNRSFNLKLILQGAIGSKAVTKWEEWERIHAEEDVRDLNIILVAVTVIVVLVLVSSLTAS